MEPNRQLREILPALSDLVDRISPDQLDQATPCAEFTVADILDHMITLGGAFSHWFRGEEPPEKVEPTEAGVPSATFRRTMEALLDAVESPGALQRTIDAPVGRMPGDTFARLVAFDGLIHGWDLAVATGQQYAPAASIVAAVDDFARQALTPDMRAEAFAPATLAPGSASELEQLIAFSGRTV